MVRGGMHLEEERLGRKVGRGQAVESGLLGSLPTSAEEHGKERGL